MLKHYMLAGSGIGKIAFDNYKVIFAIGSDCLALIIFDGAMRTSWKKPCLSPDKIRDKVVIIHSIESIYKN